MISCIVKSSNSYINLKSNLSHLAKYIWMIPIQIFSKQNCIYLYYIFILIHYPLSVLQSIYYSLNRHIDTSSIVCQLFLNESHYSSEQVLRHFQCDYLYVLNHTIMV